MAESELLKKIQLAVSTVGVRLLRNNVGMAWAGKHTLFRTPRTVKVGPGDVVVRNAYPIKYGLAVGSSDLIGWTPKVITSEHIGKTVAIFTAIECKAPTGRLSKEQAQFIKIVQNAGGISGVAFTVEQAFEVVHGL